MALLPGQTVGLLQPYEKPAPTRNDPKPAPGSIENLLKGPLGQTPYFQFTDAAYPKWWSGERMSAPEYAGGPLIDFFRSPETRKFARHFADVALESSYGDPDWVNPAYGGARASPQNWTTYGSGIPHIKDYRQAVSEFNRLMDAGDPFIQKAYGEYVGNTGQHPVGGPEIFGFLDWAYREQQREIARPDSGFGFGDLLGLAAGPIAGLIGGPLIGAAVGGISGGLKGGPLGALGGAAGGYFAGGGTLGGVKNAFTAPFKNLGGTGTAAAGSAATSAPGTFASWSKYFPTKIGGAIGPASGGFNALAASAPAWSESLGIGAQDLYSPASLGERSLGGYYSIPGGGFVTERGLGIVPNLTGGTAAPIAIPGAGWAGTYSLPGGGFVNPSALGGSASDLYTPASLGGATGGGSDLLKRAASSLAKNALGGALTGAGATEGGGAGAGAFAAPAGLPALSGGFGGVQGPGNFDFPMMAGAGAGLNAANALRTAMPAEKFAPVPGRVPGYQYTPFANFVMR